MNSQIAITPMQKFKNFACRWATTLGWIIFGIGMIIHISSCQVYQGEDVEGGKFTQSGLRFDLPGKKCDIDILSNKKRTESPEEHDERLRREAAEEKLRTELEAAKKERMYKIETKEKKRTILLWLSFGCYALAILSVVAGILLEGWKTFGTISVAMMGMGIFFMVLINMLPAFTAIVMIPVGWGVYRVMYMFKHVAFNKKSEEKVANTG
jgi:hypothetical protein